MSAPQRSNVLMIIPNYGFGGAQRVFSQLTNSLSDQYSLIEVVFNTDETDVYHGQGEKISLNIWGGTNLFTKGVNFLRRCWKLNKLKRKYQSEVTISHLEGANYVNMLSFGPGKKILCVHGSKVAEDSNRKGIIKWIENKILIPILFDRADKVVTVSHGIAHELTRFFNIRDSKIRVIQNGINVNAVERLAEEEIPHRHKHIFNRRVVLFSGRLAPQKNPLSLIDIFKESSVQVDYNLLILGDGPLKQQMQLKCRQLSLDYSDTEEGESSDARVIFLGFQTNPFQYLKHSTLFIMPSNFEGFPLAPCEALVCNVPIIATDCPTGTREILAPDSSPTSNELLQPEFAKYGVLMPLLRGVNYNQNVELWSKTIVKMITDKNLAESYRIHAKDRSIELSEDVFNNNWRELVKSVLA